MEASRFVIIGLGNVGLQLVKMLSRDFNLVCIDNNRDALDAVAQLNHPNLISVQGDASSRLVLEEAGVNRADAAIITTTTERFTLEIARILHESFDVPQVLAVGITRDGIRQLKEFGAEVENIFNISATVLRNRLDYKTKAVLGIGMEKNEILEVEVHAHSAMANKYLGSLDSFNWHVGLVYREGNIIVPQGDTVIKPRDRLIILGNPQILESVAEVLTSRGRDFPLRYGTTLTALVQGSEKDVFFQELAYLASLFPFDEVLVAHAQKSPEDMKQLKKQAEAVQLGKVRFQGLADLSPAGIRRDINRDGRRTGLLVLPRQNLLGSSWQPLPKSERKIFLRQLAEEFLCPIVLAAGTFPYEHVAVPCTSSRHMQHALETALEMVLTTHFKISAFIPRPPDYIASPEEQDEFMQVKKTISEISHAHRTSIHQSELDGNPVRAVRTALGAYSLVVGEVDAWSKKGWLHSIIRPDVEWQIMSGSRVSAVIVPPHHMMA